MYPYESGYQSISITCDSSISKYTTTKICVSSSNDGSTTNPSSNSDSTGIVIGVIIFLACIVYVLHKKKIINLDFILNKINNAKQEFAGG